MQRASHGSRGWPASAILEHVLWVNVHRDAGRCPFRFLIERNTGHISDRFPICALEEVVLTVTAPQSLMRCRCRAENLHTITGTFLHRIDEALGFPTVGAHGEPIPSKEGDIAEPEYTRLADLNEGQRACIRQVSDRDPELLRYLDRRGLVLGTQIRIAEKSPFRGPIRIDVFEGDEQHIGLDVAEAIYVDVLK